MLHTGEVLAFTSFKHCENAAFREKLGLPDDMYSKLALKALHLWMLQQRVHEDMFHDGQALIHRLYDMLWNDLENGMNAGGYLFLAKHKQNAQAAIYGGLFTYDKTLQLAAAESDYAPYLGALWRHLYSSNRNLNKNHLVQMREYIVEQRMHIRGISDPDFYGGLVSWGEPGPLVSSPEAEALDPDIALKPFFESGSEELKYGYSRTPLRSIQFEKP